MNKSNITTLSDLVTWMGETHPQEDIYLNIMGEVDEGEIKQEFEDLYEQAAKHLSIIIKTQDMW